MAPDGRALLIAAPRSGAGKTTVTLALLAALRRRGIAVRAAKAGPDYIDPGFHAAATGQPCVNLDSWAMPPALLDTLAAGDGLLVIETAMGLFDGVAGAFGRTGSGADLAARFALPVVLVLDVSGQSQSAAAVAHGFATFDPSVRVAGVILNRAGSARHAAAVTAALARTGTRVFGALPRDDAVALPARHLGLVQARERADLPTLLARLAAWAEQHLAIDALLSCAVAPRLAAGPARSALRPPGQRIALAQDVAFGFCYPHVLAGWRQAGAEIVRFSPLADEPPPPDCDVAWLPGGYPELFAGPLAAASRFLSGLRRFAATRPVHGECGGYMVLGQAITDADGKIHAMAGLLDHATSFFERRLHLGYRTARLLGTGALGAAGTVLRGHEFHYATLTPGRDDPLAALSDGVGAALGNAGGQRGLVGGSFFHAIAEAE